MAQVETYGARKQTLAPDGQARLQSTVNANTFGAQKGAALQNVGRGVQDLSASLEAVQEMEDKALVEERVNTYSDFTRERTYDPENGYVNQQGQNAVQGRADFEQDIEDQRTTIGEDLSPRQQRLYDRATQSRSRQALDTGIRHASQQRRQWFDDASTARLNTFADDALAMSDEPEKFGLQLAAGDAEILQRARMNGWGADQTNAARVEFRSGVHKNVILQRAIADPLGAQAWLDENREQMTAVHATEMARALDAPVLQARAQQEVDRITRTAPPQTGDRGGVGSAMSMLRRFEGMRTTTYWDVNHHRVGYGSDTRTDAQGVVHTVKQGDTVSQADAERDLERRTNIANTRLRGEFGEAWTSLTPAAQGALLSVDYNYGDIPAGVKAAIRSGDVNAIADAVAALQTHNDGVNAGRRISEARTIREGTTSQSVTQVRTMLEGIEDPRLRASTEAALTRRYAAEDAAARRTQRQSRIEAERFIIANPGADPTQLPLDVQQQLGVDGMNTLWAYNAQVASQGAVQTDERVYAQLQRLQAEDPTAFANDVDMFDYLGSLSTRDRREFQQLQVDAIKDQREGTETALTDARSISSAMSIADARLQEVGVRVPSRNETDGTRTREARFQRALVERMREFQRQEERVPNDYEVSDMVDQLLLPIIISQPGTVYGTRETEASVFEAPFRPDNATVAIDVPYETIPVDVRLAIRQELAIELGRDPTEDEVKADYVEFVLKGN